MDSNLNEKTGTSPAWRRFLVVGGSGVVLGALLVVANGILGGPIQFRMLRREPPRPVLTVEIPGLDLRQSRFLRLGSVVSLAEEVVVEEPVDPQYVEKVPGRVEFQPVVLERAYRGRDAFFGWRNQVERGSRQPRDVKITLVDPATGTRRLTLDRAWPSRWEGPVRDASGMAIERITLTAERVREGQ